MIPKWKTIACLLDQFPKPENQRNVSMCKGLQEKSCPQPPKKQTVRQAKLVQFSRFHPARSKVSLPAGMNMYA